MSIKIIFVLRYCSLREKGLSFDSDTVLRKYIRGV